MRIEITFNDEDAAKYREFIRYQAKSHREEECEFPGSSLEVSYHPALGDMVLLRVGSAVCEFDDVIVKHFDH